MESDDTKIAAVREWLANEVKLDRYADKLLSNGFISLETCCNIDESVLDEIGIVLLYHRRRFLQFVGKLREKLSSNNVINKGMLGGVTPSTELISNGAEQGNEREELFINHDNGCESKIIDSDSIMKESAKETNPVCGADVAVPMLPPKTRSNSAKTRPPVPPRKDLNEGTGGDESVFPGAESQNVGQQLLSNDPCLALLDATKKAPKKAPIKPPRRSILQAPSESERDKTPDSHTQDTAITRLPDHNDVPANGDFYPLNCKDIPAEGSLNMTENDSVKTSKEQGVKESSSNENIGADISNYSCPIEPKRPAPMVPLRSGPKKPIPVPRSRVKSEEGVNPAPVPPNRSKSNGENEEFPTESNVVSPPATNSFLFPEGNKTERKAMTLPKSFPHSARGMESSPLPSRQTSASLKESRGFPNIPLPPVPCAEDSEKSQEKLIEVHQQGMIMYLHG